MDSIITYTFAPQTVKNPPMDYDALHTTPQQGDINSLPSLAPENQTNEVQMPIVSQQVGTDSLQPQMEAPVTINVNELPNFYTSIDSAEQATIVNISRTAPNTNALIEVSAIRNTLGNKFFNSNDWMIGVFTLTFALVIFTRLVYKEYFTTTLRAIFDTKASDSLYKKRNSQKYRISFLITFVFAINIALFAVQITNFLHISVIPLPDFANFLIYFTGIMFFYMVKRLFINLLGFVLKKQKTFYEYVHNTSLYNKAVGLALFPFLLGIPFIIESLDRFIVILAFITIAVLYLIRFVRGFKIILNKKISFFYSILYICTLEIAPLFVLYRALKQLSSSGLIAQLVAML